jgi:DUF971 family protein
MNTTNTSDPARNTEATAADGAAFSSASSPAHPWQRVLDELCRVRPPYPEATVRWAMEQRDVLAPHFLAELERVAQNPVQVAAEAEDDNALFSWAYLFLAAWRDTRAWQPMLAVLRAPYETVDLLLGDALFENYGRALASVCPGEVEPLRELVEDGAISNWVRGTVLDTWRLRVMRSGASAHDFEDCLLALGEKNAAAIRRKDRCGKGEIELINAIVQQAMTLRSKRLRPVVLGWFDEHLADAEIVSRKTYDRATAGDEVDEIDRLDDIRRGYIEDPALETRWWAGWQAPRPLSVASKWPGILPGGADEAYLRGDGPPPPHQPYLRDTPKVGRNDPCPCGSGLKFKKCHGTN